MFKIVYYFVIFTSKNKVYQNINKNWKILYLGALDNSILKKKKINKYYYQIRKEVSGFHATGLDSSIFNELLFNMKKKEDPAISAW